MALLHPVIFHVPGTELNGGVPHTLRLNLTDEEMQGLRDALRLNCTWFYPAEVAINLHICPVIDGLMPEAEKPITHPPTYKEGERFAPDRGTPGCTCGTPPFAPREADDDCPFHGTLDGKLDPRENPLGP